MNMMLIKMMKRFNEAGDGGSDAGGTGTAEASPQSEDRGDVVDPELNANTLASLVGEGAEGSDGDEPNGKETAAEDSDENQENESADEVGQGGRTTGIPPGRFNEVNQKRKEAEAALEAAQKEIERLKQGSQTATPVAAPSSGVPATDAGGAFDEDAQEQAYVAALLEGDPKKAAEIRKGINAHLRAEAANTAIQRAEEQRQAEQQQAIGKALQAESVIAVEKYPYLDSPEGAEALELIIAARDAKMAKGIPAHEALRSAVATIAPKFAPDAGASTPSRVSKDEADATDSRTSAAIARGAAASVAQPPALNGGVGDRASAGRVSVEKMTDDQFDQLSDAEKRRMRGD